MGTVTAVNKHQAVVKAKVTIKVIVKPWELIKFELRKYSVRNQKLNEVMNVMSAVNIGVVILDKAVIVL